MATDKQTQANRLNARKSTGPRSAEGKAVSSQNALKSGMDAQSQINRGEDRTFAALLDEYLHDHQPQSAIERALVDILVEAEWTLRRLRRTEAQLWEKELADSATKVYYPEGAIPQNLALGRAFDKSQMAFMRLERRRDCVQRTYHRAQKELRELQSARPGLPASPSGGQTTLRAATHSSFIPRA
jgi:hypothetical protein